MEKARRKHLIWRRPYRTIAVTSSGFVTLLLLILLPNGLLYLVFHSIWLPLVVDFALLVWLYSSAKRHWKSRGIRVDFKPDDGDGLAGVGARKPSDPTPRSGSNAKSRDEE